MRQGPVLGIDPGSRATGYGILRHTGSGLACVHAGVVRTGGCRCLAERLDKIYSGILRVIDRFHPETAAVEEVFQSINPKSALVLGHARGAAMLAAVHRGLEIFEYSPMEIKLAVVGYGRAEKVQVQQMVKVILGLSGVPPQDAADALAVAICHAHSKACLRLRG